MIAFCKFSGIFVGEDMKVSLFDLTDFDVILIDEIYQKKHINLLSVINPLEMKVPNI